MLLVEFNAETTFELRLNPPALTLLPVILPLALIAPVTLTPVVVNTATFDVPPIVMLALPFGVWISTEVVPLVILSPTMLPLSEALPVTVRSPVTTVFPPTLNAPAVFKFAPATLPVAFIELGLNVPTDNVPSAIMLPVVEMPVVPSS